MTNNSVTVGEGINLSAVHQQNDYDSTYYDLNNARVHPSKKKKRPRFRLTTKEERDRTNNFNDIMSNYNNKEKIQEILKKDGMLRDKSEEKTKKTSKPVVVMRGRKTQVNEIDLGIPSANA